MKSFAFKNNWIFVLYLVLLGTSLTIAVSSVYNSGPVWDDEIEFIGLLDQISFGRNLLFNREHANLDYESAIATNLEFYGVVNKIAGLAIFRIIVYIASVIPFIHVSDEFMGSVLINKVFTVILFFVTLHIVSLTAKLLELRRPYIPSLLLLGFPTFLGHSWLNIKDIPFACSYSLLTLSAILYLKQCEDPQRLKTTLVLPRELAVSPRFFLVIAATLTVACRPAFIPIALFTVFITTILSKQLSKPHGFYNLFNDILFNITGLIIFSSALIPASWVNPISYFIKTVSVHSSHPWGGCMFINQQCRGISSSYTTLHYLSDWLIVRLPLVHQGVILLSIVSVLGLILIGLWQQSCKLVNLAYPEIIHGLARRTQIFLLLQAFGLPLLAIINNSNTYDGLRHWLFCFPALFLVCCSSIERFLDVTVAQGMTRIVLERIGLFMMCVGVSFSMIDAAAIAPYTYAYMNEYSRISNDHTTIDLDYWGASSKEIAFGIHKRGWIISNIMDNGSAEHVIYPKLYLEDKRFPPKETFPVVATVHKRFATEASRLENKECDEKFVISRRLMFGRPLNIATTGVNCRD